MTSHSSSRGNRFRAGFNPAANRGVEPTKILLFNRWPNRWREDGWSALLFMVVKTATPYLFDSEGLPATAKHLKNIFESVELSREATVSKTEMVHSDQAILVTLEAA